MEQIIEKISEILRTADKEFDSGRVIQPTFLYNEGWMLRSVMQWFHTHNNCKFETPMSNGKKWFSEALLSSPFLAAYQKDSLSETHTHADGVFGDFTIGNSGIGDLAIDNNWSHFVVIEAKMFSKLSPKITHADFYNQAARTIACMCQVLSGQLPVKKESQYVGFYVIAPESQLDNEKTFKEFTDVENIKKTVIRRVKQYNKEGRASDYNTHKSWYENIFLPFCDAVKIKLISWETIITFITADDSEYGKCLKDFYVQCLKYNQ